MRYADLVAPLALALGAEVCFFVARSTCTVLSAKNNPLQSSRLDQCTTATHTVVVPIFPAQHSHALSSITPVLSRYCKGFAPSPVGIVRRGVVTRSTDPAYRQHEHASDGGRGPRSASPLPVLSASSPSASPSSPADLFTALFGGNKKTSTKRGSRAEALEADLLSAIEGVQGRGRCDPLCAARVL